MGFELGAEGCLRHLQAQARDLGARGRALRRTQQTGLQLLEQGRWREVLRLPVGCGEEAYEQEDRETQPRLAQPAQEHHGEDGKQYDPKQVQDARHPRWHQQELQVFIAQHRAIPGQIEAIPGPFR